MNLWEGKELAVTTIREQYLNANGGKVVQAAAMLAYNFSLDDPRVCKRGYEPEAALAAAETFFPEVRLDEDLRLAVKVGLDVLRETRGTTVEEAERV